MTTFYWPSSLRKTGHSNTLVQYGNAGLLLPRLQEPSTYELLPVGGSYRLTSGVAIATASGMVGGFIGSCTNGGTGVWLLGAYGDVSIFDPPSAIAGVSGVSFVAAAYSSGQAHPYFAAANGSIYSVSGSALAALSPGWGESQADLAADVSKLYAVLPASNRLGIYTFSSAFAGSVAKQALPITGSFVAASSAGVAVGGWTGSTLAFGATCFKPHPSGVFAVTTTPATNRVTLLSGREPVWAVASIVGGGGDPQAAAWALGGTQVLITNTAAGTVVVLGLQFGNLVFDQTISVPGATQIAMSLDGATAFVTSPSQGRITVLTATVGVWAVSQVLTAPAATAILVLSSTAICAGTSGGVAFIDFVNGTWSITVTQAVVGAYTPVGLATDGRGNIFASGATRVNAVTKTGALGNIVLSGNAQGIFYQQGQIAVADDAGPLIHILSFSFVTNTFTERATLTAPAGCKNFGSSSPSVWLCGTSAVWQYVYTAPFTLVPQRAGAVTFWNGSSFTTAAALPVGHQPSAATWDALGSCWVVTLQNDLYQYTVNGVVLSTQSLTPQSSSSTGVPSSLGVSDMTWWQNGLWGASTQNESAMRLASGPPVTPVSAIRGVGSLRVTVVGVLNPNASATLDGRAAVIVNVTQLSGSLADVVVLGAATVAVDSIHRPTVAARLDGVIGVATAATVTPSSRAILAGTVTVTANASIRSGVASATILGRGGVFVGALTSGLVRSRIDSRVTLTVDANVATVTAVTWNPFDVANVTLSNSNKTATSTGIGVPLGTRAITSHNSSDLGAYYFEITSGSQEAAEGVGLANANWNEADPGGLGDNNSIAMSVIGDVYVASTVDTSGQTSWTTGAVLGVVYNPSANKAWFSVNGNFQITAQTDDPSNNVGGYSMAGLTGGPYFPAWCGNQETSTPEVKTINGSGPFSFMPASGSVTIRQWGGVTTGLPGAPVVTITNVSASGFTMNWTAASGVGPMTYTAQTGVHGSTPPWNTVAGGISGLSTTVTGLNANTNYDTRVIATNAAGSTNSAVVSQTTVNESLNQAIVTSTSGSLIDANGNVWTITSGAQVAENGTTNTLTSGVVELLYWNHTVYYENSTGNWFFWTGTTFQSTTNPIAESPSGTVITTVTQQIVDGSGATWTLFAHSPSNQVARNGTVDTTTAAVLILYYNHQVYYQNPSGAWFLFGGTLGSWTQQAGDPRTSTTTTSTTSTTTPSPTTTPAPGGLTWWTNPGGDGSWWKLPMQTGLNALWDRSSSMVGSLRSGRGSVVVGQFGNAQWSTPWVRGFASDPLVTVTDMFGHTIPGGLRIPVGTTSANMGDSGDNSLGGVDTTRPYRVWNLNNACINAPLNGGSGSIQAGSGNYINCNAILVADGSGPLMMDALTRIEWESSDNAFGSITDYDLTAARLDSNYVIQHMLTCLLDINQTRSTPTWPVITADAQASGSIPEGALVGIPADVPMPSGLSRGGRLLWQNLQQFGWMPYNDGATGGIRMVIWLIDSANWNIANDISNSFDSMRPYLCLYTGSTSLSNMKGMVGGVRSDAFPAPPLLDYSPTGGVPVQPSSFGAWFGTMNNGSTSGIFYDTIWQPTGSSTTTTTTTTPGPTGNYIEVDLGSSATVTDSQGTVWGLVQRAGGGVATQNGVDNTASSYCDILVYVNATQIIWIRDQNSTANWYSWSGFWAGPSADPRSGGPGTTTTTTTTSTTTTTPAPGAYYTDTFNSASDLQSTRTVQAGNKWALIDINSPDGRGGPSAAEFGSQYWVNIYAPGFSVPGLYSVANGQFRLGLAVTPAGIQSAVDNQAGAHMPYVGTLVNSTPSYWQPHKYHEVVASVPRIPGFAFQACLEAPSSVRWPPEIDIAIYTNADSTQHILLNVFSTSAGFQHPATTTLQPAGWDGTVANTYGVDVGTTNITFYLNSVQIFQTPTPTDTSGGTRDYDLPLQWYLLTASAYWGDLTNPNPNQLPAYALVDSVTIWNSRPGISTTTTTTTGTSTSTTTGAPGNAKATILNFIGSMANNHVMIGQYVDTGSTKELDEFVSATGKHVAVASQSYIPAWPNTYRANTGPVNQIAIAHWNAGGLVQIDSFLPDPVGGDIYGTCTPAQVITSGTAQYNAVHSMYDDEIVGLLALKAAGVVPMYRCFSESIGDWFWWGVGNGHLGWTFAQWITMWQQRHDYYLSKGCDHLIWIWAACPPDIYPGDAYVDIVAEDFYLDNIHDVQSRYDTEVSQHPAKPWGMAEWGNGGPSFGSASYDARQVISDVQTYMPKTCWITAWLDAPPTYVWGWGALSHVADVANDPYVKVRENLGRPNTVGTSTTTTTPGPGTTTTTTTTPVPTTTPAPTTTLPPTAYTEIDLGSSATVTDSAGTVWGLVQRAGGGVATQNGTDNAASSYCDILVYVNATHVIWIRDQYSTANWYSWSGFWAGPSADPRGGGPGPTTTSTTTTPAPGTTPVPGGPGHGPTLRTPSNAQVFPGRSNGQQWGNILVSTGVNVDTQQGIQYGNITYSAIESNSDYWAEFGRYGEIKNLFEGCTAVFFTDGVVLGPPDVPLDPNHNIYYTIGNYTGGYVIVRYAFGNVNMVINDFSIARGDFLNVDRAYAGITVTHPSWGTLIQVTNSGTISLYGVTLNASDVDRS